MSEPLPTETHGVPNETSLPASSAAPAAPASPDGDAQPEAGESILPGEPMPDVDLISDFPCTPSADGDEVSGPEILPAWESSDLPSLAGSELLADPAPVFAGEELSGKEAEPEGAGEQSSSEGEAPRAEPATEAAALEPAAPASGAELAAETEETGAGKEGLPEGIEPAEEDSGAATPEGGGPTAEDEWGYVDEYGNVRQRATAQLAERIIGRIRNGDAPASLAYYRQRFGQLEHRFEELRQQVEATDERGRLLGRIRHLVEYVPRADAVGDYDALLERLRTLEREVTEHVDRLHGERRQRKEELCARAESLAESTDWKPTSDILRTMQEEWKGVGYSGRDQDEVLWKRFRTAQDRFFQRRQESWDEARTRKTELCERAEALADSTEWKKTGDQMKSLQEEWKRVGSAGREQDDVLWKRFRGAQDRFFNHRSEVLDARNKEEQENLRKKEVLCVQIEALLNYPDPFVATTQAKELQAQWKQVGPAPRDQMDAIWRRFRKSCDVIFSRASEERDRRKNEKDRRQDEWKTRMAETLERKTEQAERLRESLQHDQANIARWEETLQSLRSGGRAEEIRYSLETKITDVQARMQTKQERLAELDSSIRDIQARLKHR